MKCFFCDGGLCNWEVNDEPWTEHARWFPDCGFVKQCKGMNFIKKVQDIGVNGGPVISGNDGMFEAILSTSAHQSAARTSSSSPSMSLTMDQKREVRAAMSSPCVVKVLKMRSQFLT